MDGGKQQKRAVIEVACAACHAAKRKCTGAPCARCAKLGRECVEYVPKKRGPQPGKKRAVAVEKSESGAFSNRDQWAVRAAPERDQWAVGAVGGASLAFEDVPVTNPAMLALLLRYAARSMIVERPIDVANSLGLQLGGNFIAVEFPRLSSPSSSSSLAEWCLQGLVVAAHADDTIPQLRGSDDYYKDKRIGEFCVRESGAEQMMERALKASKPSSGLPHVRSIQHAKLIYSRTAKLFRATMRMTIVLDEMGAPRYGFVTVLSAADEAVPELWPSDQDDLAALGDADLSFLDNSTDWSGSVESDFFDLGTTLAIGGIE